jgi:hypothetical protein
LPLLFQNKVHKFCFSSGASITAEEAQDAMENFVASNCCYGSSPAKEMEIRDITPSSAYHVRNKE